MTRLLRVVGVSAAIAAMAATESVAQPAAPSTQEYVRLDNALRGQRMNLDISNNPSLDGMALLQRKQIASGQFWRLRLMRDAWYHLSTMYRGPGMCLDVYASGRFADLAYLAACGEGAGQDWRFLSDGDGGWRLKNRREDDGDSKCLTVFQTGSFRNMAYLASCKDADSQRWHLHETGTPVRD